MSCNISKARIGADIRNGWMPDLYEREDHPDVNFAQDSEKYVSEAFVPLGDLQYVFGSSFPTGDTYSFYIAPLGELTTDVLWQWNLAFPENAAEEVLTVDPVYNFDDALIESVDIEQVGAILVIKLGAGVDNRSDRSIPVFGEVSANAICDNNVVSTATFRFGFPGWQPE